MARSWGSLPQKGAALRRDAQPAMRRGREEERPARSSQGTASTDLPATCVSCLTHTNDGQSLTAPSDATRSSGWKPWRKPEFSADKSFCSMFTSLLTVLRCPGLKQNCQGVLSVRRPPHPPPLQVQAGVRPDRPLASASCFIGK